MSPSGPIDPLAGLRGWHLPDPVSWWPPAPGWWALGALVIAIAAVALWWAQSRYRDRAAARAARRELRELREVYGEGGDASAFARGISRLLRRYAIARFPPREVAGLAGADWLDFLDARGGNGRFRTGPGRLLAEAPYRPGREIPVDDLAALVQDWIVQNAVKRP